MLPSRFRRQKAWSPWWGMVAGALLGLAPALADEASDLLGKAPLAPAVRKMIDTAPVAATTAKLSVGSGDADEDLPDNAAIPSLDKLKLKRIKIVGQSSAGGGDGGSAEGLSPIDIHAGRLEAHATVNLPGENPVIKPSGVHILDVVLALQKPAPESTDPSSPMDILNRLRKPDPQGPGVTPKIPDDAAGRLKEAQASLSDLGKLLPDDGRRIVDNINKAISPDAIKDPPDLLAKLKELVPEEPLLPDDDWRGEDFRKPGELDGNMRTLDDLLARLDIRSADPADPDADKWAALRDKIKDLSPEEVPMKDLDDLIKRRTPGDGPTPRSISAEIDNFTAKVEGRIKDRIDVATGQATEAIRSKVSGAVSNVSQKINDSLDKAFASLSDVCKQEGLKHKASADEYAKQAANVQVPPIQYEDCNCYRCSKCLWTSHCCCASCPIPDTVKANADASAKKSALEGQAKSEEEQSKKFYAAADTVIVKKNEIETNLADLFSGVNRQISSISLSPVAVEEGGDDSDGSSQPGGNAQPRHPHGQSFSDRHLVDRFLQILGDTNLTLVMVDNINASIGANATTIQRIAATGGGMGTKIVLSEMDTDMSMGAVNAAIGVNSLAQQIMESLGTDDSNQRVGRVRARRDVDGAINAAIGANTLADMRIASIGGSSPGGVDMATRVAGAVNAAIGYSSTATTWIGNLDGVVGGTSNIFTLSTGAVSAAIGASTESTIRLGNLAPTAKVGGNYRNRLVQPGGAIAAAIGYRSNSTVGLGNIDGTVQGNATVNVDSGPVISASIGGASTAINRMAELAPGVRVGGNLDLNVKALGITAFAVGASTTARNEVGVIDAPVTGNARIAVNVGEIVTGTVGVNTGASAVIGSIKAPVNGSADISVSAGGINTFAIGLSTDKTIRSDTYVGSVLQATNGPVKINVSTGGIFTLGFGLVLDLGPLGTLDFSRQGCTQIGNIGSGC